MRMTSQFLRAFSADFIATVTFPDTNLASGAAGRPLVAARGRAEGWSTPE